MAGEALTERAASKAAENGTKPLVTVVIPTRNRRELLLRAIRTALAQEGVDLEVIVVDDGSTDDTLQQLEAAAFDRVRVISHPTSRGVAATRNLGIQAARGDWIAFLDDDDFWAPGKLRRQLDAAAADVSFVYSGMVIVDASTTMVGLVRAVPQQALDPGLYEENLVGSPSSVIVRTDLARSLGGFDETLSTLADWDMWIRLLDVGRGVGCPEPLVGYTVHADNMHVQDPAGLRREVRALRRRHRRAIRARRVTFGGLEFQRWLAGRYRSTGRRIGAARLYLGTGLRHRSARDLARAAGLVLGEATIRRVTRHSRRSSDPFEPEPDWLVHVRERSGPHGP